MGEVKLIYVKVKEEKGEKKLSVFGAGYQEDNKVVFVPISTETRSYDLNESGIDIAVKQIEEVAGDNVEFECRKDRESIEYFIKILSKLFIPAQNVNLQLTQGGFHLTLLPVGHAGIQLQYAIRFLEDQMKILDE